MASDSMHPDLSHHFSDVALARGVSPLTGLQRYFNKPGLISLAGGLPNPTSFPFHSIGAEVVLPETPLLSQQQNDGIFGWFWKLFSAEDTVTRPRTASLLVPKYPARPGELSLSTALQYSTAEGLDIFRQILREFTSIVYQPGFRDWTVLVHAGNTAAWSNVLATFCNPGEGVLVDEFTYPTALAAMLPHNVHPVPLAMDKAGIRPDVLRKTMEEWDEPSVGMRRPHVLYVVPVGQNPTGLTMPANRKKQIYDVCREFDIIIVEDDPFYFFQMGGYRPRWERAFPDVQDTMQYLGSLEPSFIKFDVEGRVIRLDTFSQTLAPGVRLGWYTCSPLFAERLERTTEVTALGACGFSQSLVTSLLLQWKHDGYLRWLQSLAMQYKTRRNFMLDCIGETFQLSSVVENQGLLEGCEVYYGYGRSSGNYAMTEKSAMSPWFSFVAPTAGVFVWLTIFFENHPLWESVGQKTLEMRLWTAAAEKGVLFAPGWMFDGKGASGSDNNIGHFRVSYSYVEYNAMKQAIGIFYQVLDQFYGLKE